MIESTLKIGESIYCQAVFPSDHFDRDHVEKATRETAAKQLMDLLVANKDKDFSITYSESLAAREYMRNYSEFTVEIVLKPIDHVYSVYPKNPGDIHAEPQRILEERW